MINGLKVFVALLGVVAAGGIADLSNHGLISTAVAQQCGCGKPSCGGCLFGRLKKRAPVETFVDETVTNDVVVSTVYGPPIEHAAAPCQTCTAEVPCQSCVAPAPEPECLYCELKTKKVKEDKTSFKIEQKEVCVPAVRLPWMKCCPPKKSRVRTVNVLKTHKYKADTCEYKWSVHEPEEFDNDSNSSGEPTAAAKESVVAPASNAYPDPSADSPPTPKLSDPADALNDVPRPPMEK